MGQIEHWLVWRPGGAMIDDRAVVVWNESDLREYQERGWRIEGPFTANTQGGEAVMKAVLNGLAADALRIVAAGLERLHLAAWWCIGWLDGGR